MSSNFLFSKISWQHPAMFCLITSIKLSRQQFQFLRKAKVMGSNPGYLIKSFLLYKITAKSLDSITLGSPLFWKREKIKSFLCCTGVCSLMPLACKISSFHQPCFFFSLGVWCSNLDWKGFYLHKHTLCSLDAPVCYTFSPFSWKSVFPFSFSNPS